MLFVDLFLSCPGRLAKGADHATRPQYQTLSEPERLAAPVRRPDAIGAGDVERQELLIAAPTGILRQLDLGLSLFQVEASGPWHIRAIEFNAPK